MSLIIDDNNPEIQNLNEINSVDETGTKKSKKRKKKSTEAQDLREVITFEAPVTEVIQLNE